MNNWCFLFRILSSFLGPLPEPARAISHSWNQLKSAKLLGHTKLTDLLEQLKILLGGEGEELTCNLSYYPGNSRLKKIHPN